MRDIVKGLQIKVDQIEAEISKLYYNRKLLLETMGIFGGPDKVEMDYTAVEEVKVSKSHKKVKPASSKSDKPGKEKFLPYVRGILQANPGREYDIKEVLTFVQKAVDKGIISSGAKKVSDAVCAGLCSLASRNIISKYKNEDGRNIYVYKGTPKSKKQIKEESEVSTVSNSLLQEAILEISKDNSYTCNEITEIIRRGNNYLDISKNLNGTLKDSVKQEVETLVRQNTIDQDIHTGKIINLN